ncbi:uncharacterized protein SPPG_04547 [Spizellomyces punctatus DAOM BR117]|uniref:Protein YOP1 n=1 Tax=Spizellomyces punctatus (strain DAOM BR117) TaxID=645134 RepID=A0A0L0HGI9_SPIPD|nr:uncharacterized protein SPPG_04547 [Spizellomyces punctatus DAOM BR117]KND00213.1 hypothetical protein SPPG_04547 [Spizellomyces punctatus DAOM BR117]|eukprot:XP_016608252.1 hypothetical protein SPPG_04547 [Spizellomyces punctatus DAOM BR117]
MFVSLAKIACYALGGYSTFKTVEGRPNVGKRQRWASFWITLTVFEVIEPILDWTIFWIPFYYNVKLLFLLALCYGRTKTTMPVFKKVIHPVLSHKRKHIEHYERRITESVTIVHTRVVTIVRRVTARLPQLQGPSISEPIIIEEDDAHPSQENDVNASETANFNQPKTDAAETAAVAAEVVTERQDEGDELEERLYPSVDEAKLGTTPSPLVHRDSAVDVREDVSSNSVAAAEASEASSTTTTTVSEKTDLDTAPKVDARPPLPRSVTSKLQRSRSVINRETESGRLGRGIQRSVSTTRLSPSAMEKVSKMKQGKEDPSGDDADVETAESGAESEQQSSVTQRRTTPVRDAKVTASRTRGASSSLSRATRGKSVEPTRRTSRSVTVKKD